MTCAWTNSSVSGPARERTELRRRRDTRGGFTLLELLIATAVGAVVLLVIQTTYFSALHLHNTTHARIDQDLELQRALGIIRRDFAGLMLPGGTLSGQFQTENFSNPGTENYGDRIGPDFFTNTGRIDAYNSFSEVQRVAYYLATPTATEGGDGRSKNLVRVVTRNLLPVQETEEGEQQVLLEGVDSAVMTFFDGISWTDMWDSEATSTLPRALKLSITLMAPAGTPTAPAPVDLVVPVPVRTTASEREDEEMATP